MTTTYINGKMQYKSIIPDWSNMCEDYFGCGAYSDIESKEIIPRSLFYCGNHEDYISKTIEHIDEYEAYNPQNIPLIEGCLYNVNIIYFEDGELAEIIELLDNEQEKNTDHRLP